MISSIPKEWLYPESLEQATIVQRQLAEKLILVDAFAPLQCIGGMDVSNSPYDETKQIYATAVLLHKEPLQKFADSYVVQQQTFPYIPGFLGFREAPALIEAFGKLPQRPDLIFVDGHGVSHPRSMGIASHIGALLDIPTIGVAKTILVGKPAAQLGNEIGDTTPLMWKGKTIGMLLRSKNRCLPLIVSSGHRVSLDTAIDLVKSVLKGYRLPEPTRHAHLTANFYRKKAQEKA